jgi:hypothetical protein
VGDAAGVPTSGADVISDRRGSRSLVAGWLPQAA